MPRKKRGPGRPVTTGSRGTPVVSFRLSADQFKALSGYGASHRMSPNQAARYIASVYLCLSEWWPGIEARAGAAVDVNKRSSGTAVCLRGKVAFDGTIGGRLTINVDCGFEDGRVIIGSAIKALSEESTPGTK